MKELMNELYFCYIIIIMIAQFDLIVCNKTQNDSLLAVNYFQ